MVMAQFILATETGDEAEPSARMAEILEYNEEDLAATWAVLQGSLQSVSDDSVVIRLTAGEQTVAKDNILRVSAKRTSHRLRNLALGAGVGLGGGAAIGAAADNPRGMFSRGQMAGGGAVVRLLVGAAVGAAIPTGGWREVYRAR